MALLAGVSAPLILTAAADGGFVGVHTIRKPNDYGILTFNVFAEFDNMGNDWLDAVGGTANTPLEIVIPGGTFWNHWTGGDTAPRQALVNIYPSLAYDSFYTIGLRVIPMGGSDDTNLVNMPTLGGYYGPFVSSVSTTNGYWATVPPTSPQSDPWAPQSGGGAGMVLIGQFSTTTGGGIYGSLLVEFVADGVLGQQAVSIEWAGEDCIVDEDCDDGDPCNGGEFCVGFFCWDQWPVPDCNNNRVLDSCDIDNGTSLDCNGNGVPDDCDIDDGTSPDINGNGVPDECECVADCSGDGEVSVSDFLLLLSQWGDVGSGCDLDGGGVGITDFLYLLAHWGPCP
jgi:hypothetical protein